MVDRPEDTKARTLHWDTVYRGHNADDLSWYEDQPTVSLELVDSMQVDKGPRVIDVGGGASYLVDALVARGFADVSVLDVSATALTVSRDRLSDAAAVTWIERDLLAWDPPRVYDLWHDRAVFHFLSADEVTSYHDTLRRAVAPRGHVIMATFAPDGPTHCSGLAVTRYDVDQLRDFLGDEFQVVRSRREMHTTPNGAPQPFTWIVAQRIRD